MDTNQTIDGVPRELLEKSLRDAKIVRFQTDKHVIALRALLDAPAYPNRLCHIDYTAHPYICGCLKGDEEAQRRFDEHQGKAAEPQAEPVAWRWMQAHKNEWEYGSELPTCVIGAWAPLYTDQPAPAAVALPERKAARSHNSHDWDEGYSDGWKAYDDELKRLNPSL